MIKQEIYIEKYDWTIHAFYHHTHYDIDDIMECLWMVECDSKTARKAYENLSSGELNTGLCYSNYHNKETVFVIAKTSNSCQFANSWHHEMCHLIAHIGRVYNLDPLGEESAYLSGEISMKMFPAIKDFLCEGCRKNIYGK